MERIKVPIRFCPHFHGLPRPGYQTGGAAGMDLVAAIEDEMLLKPGKFVLVPTGMRIQLPQGYEAQIRPRSGLALKFGITVLNSPGTIDSDYRGEINIILINFGKDDFTIKRGMRIAQMVVSKISRVEFEENGLWEETERNTAGFGHTGV